MIENIIESIERFVNAIYDIDQIDLQERYLEFIENIDCFIGKMAELGYNVDLNEDLINIAEGMQNKDYIEVADILLYTIKPDFQKLQLNGLDL